MSGTWGWSSMQAHPPSSPPVCGPCSGSSKGPMPGCQAQGAPRERCAFASTPPSTTPRDTATTPTASLPTTPRARPPGLPLQGGPYGIKIPFGSHRGRVRPPPPAPTAQRLAPLITSPPNQQRGQDAWQLRTGLPFRWNTHGMMRPVARSRALVRSRCRSSKALRPATTPKRRQCWCAFTVPLIWSATGHQSGNRVVVVRLHVRSVVFRLSSTDLGI